MIAQLLAIAGGLGFLIGLIMGVVSGCESGRQLRQLRQPRTRKPAFQPPGQGR